MCQAVLQVRAVQQARVRQPPCWQYGDDVAGKAAAVSLTHGTGCVRATVCANVCACVLVVQELRQQMLRDIKILSDAQAVPGLLLFLGAYLVPDRDQVTMQVAGLNIAPHGTLADWHTLFPRVSCLGAACSRVHAGLHSTLGCWASHAGRILRATKCAGRHCASTVVTLCCTALMHL